MSNRFLVVFALIFGLRAGQAEAAGFRTPLVLSARSGQASIWRYTVEDPGTAWSDSAFDDFAWRTGPGGFGSGHPQNGLVATEWSTGHIWLRTAFTVPDIAYRSVVLSLYHDEDVQIFLNGQRVYEEAGYFLNYSEPGLPEGFQAALRPGRNVLAIACANVDGAAYIDAGLYLESDFGTTVLAGDARTANPAEWNYTTLDPGPQWNKADFDAASWSPGQGGFGSPEYITATPWTDSSIWMRTTFQADSAYSRYGLSFAYDDAMEVYLNGVPVFQAKGWDVAYQNILSPEAGKAVRAGANVLAVHCRNLQGAQFIDVGVWGLESPPAEALRPRLPAARRELPPLLRAGAHGVDISALPGRGRLCVFAPDGRLALAAGGSVAGYLPLPVTLGAGVYRYRWESGQGSRQGTLLRLP